MLKYLLLAGKNLKYNSFQKSYKFKLQFLTKKIHHWSWFIFYSSFAEIFWTHRKSQVVEFDISKAKFFKLENISLSIICIPLIFLKSLEYCLQVWGKTHLLNTKLVAYIQRPLDFNELVSSLWKTFITSMLLETYVICKSVFIVIIPTKLLVRFFFRIENI